MRADGSARWAYAALLAAMLISSGNFVLGNLAMREVEPWTLTFWRTAIALVCLLPLALEAKRDLAGYFRRQKLKVLVLSVTGVILPAWFMYLSLRSDDLINLSVGYTFIPLMAVLLSALLLAERLSAVQYLGLGAAFAGALVFAFHGDLQKLMSFDPHEAFLWMMAVCLARSAYLVLLRKWDMHPSPGEGLFVLLVLGTALLIPGFIGQEVASGEPLDYPWPVWGSIAFIGIGMGALYLHLISFGTGRVGATRASLFTYTVPLFVAIQSVLFLGSHRSSIRASARCSWSARSFSYRGFASSSRIRARFTTEPDPNAAQLGERPRRAGGVSRLEGGRLRQGPLLAMDGDLSVSLQCTMKRTAVEARHSFAHRGEDCLDLEH